ncbi:MAG: hypothetical protein A2021_03715 [Elusimicrobia bacterium GWF2_52_66]|nr:MAG: hypothetical protein A2X33_06360 [Elusimicrobia bacterium GWA2_51_34]OGR85072.1 MAG: hypothetical protein A2021_03715 [Elusimicrobia bacterium GWF2_52_66]
MKKTILLSLLVPLAFCATLSVRAEIVSSRSSIEAKLALENSLEKRLKTVLSEALGTEDIIVIISAELQEEEKKTASDILPGIPKEEKMGELSLSSTLTMLKKLSASLILDKSIPDEDSKLARKLTAGLLGLPPEREDLITIEKMNFRKTRPFTAGDLLAPPNIWNLAWITLVAVLMVTAIVVFLSPLSRAAKAFVEAFAAKTTLADGQHHEERREVEIAEIKTASLADSVQGGKKPVFGFLSAENISSLIFLMGTRTTQDLTIILNYAPKDVSAKLVEALYPRSIEALAALPKVALMPEKDIRALEAEIMAALDYVVGGEDKTLGIVEILDETVQEKAMADFTRFNPLFSIKARSSIVKLADLARLEPAHAQMLARRLSMRIIAAALKGSAYTNAFVAKLSSGMQERLNQEMELTRDLPAGAYKAERAKVTEALRQLIKEGLVSLNTKTAAEPPPPHAAAASRTAATTTVPDSARPAAPTSPSDQAKIVPSGGKPPSAPAKT